MVDIREHHPETGAGRRRCRPRYEELNRGNVTACGNERPYRTEEVEFVRVGQVQILEIVVADPKPTARRREHRAASAREHGLIEEISGEVVDVGELRRDCIPVDLAPTTAE